MKYLKLIIGVSALFSNYAFDQISNQVGSIKQLKEIIITYQADKLNSFTFNDHYLVATEHSTRIDKSILADNPLIIIDADIQTTKSYSLFSFEKELEISTDIYNSNRANIYLYLNNDVEYLQDGTRLSVADRNLLDLSHRQVLTYHNIEIIDVKCDWVERFEKAVEQINKLIATNEKKHWA